MEMAPNYKAELVGVFGSPVAENPTGVMQEAGFAALGLNWRYLTIEVRREDLAAAMQGMRAMNFAGINCTIPHKVAVLQYLDEVSPDARLMGAVNTVRRAGNRLIGENTDGKGFLRALRDDAGVDPQGKHVVVLGAGGAARAVCVELALAGAQTIDVVNRTPERAQELVWLLNEHTPVKAAYVPWMSGLRVAAATDLLVNCTSIGLYPDVGGIPDIDTHAIAPHMVVCDVIPNPPNTPLLRAAAARGAKTIDGLGMLVYQGAIAFKMWTGHDAPVAVMKSALAAEFGL
jgi:shikimate dehydrogenase